MKTVHEELLDEAVAHSRNWAAGLRDRAVLVTGASGFLASSVLVFLSRLNREFQLNLDLHATARRPPSEVPLFQFMGIEAPAQWVCESVQQTTVPGIPGIIVLHAASFGSPTDYQREPIETFGANTLGLLHLYERSAAARASRVVYLSSAEVYGQPPTAQIPTPEDYPGSLPTLAPRSVYGESKRMAEVLGACQAQSTGIPFTAIRPWNIYGPGQRPADGRVPMEFVRQAIGNREIRLISDGSPMRSFCHAWTGVRQIVGLLAGTSDSVSAWNVGFGGEEISMLETARLCARSCGFPESIVHHDPHAVAPGMKRSAPDTSKVDRLLGPAPVVPLERGLATLREWVDFLQSR